MRRPPEAIAGRRIVVTANPKVLWLVASIAVATWAFMAWRGYGLMPDPVLSGIFAIIFGYCLTRRLEYADGILTSRYYAFREWSIDPRQARVSVRQAIQEEWDFELPDGRTVSLRPVLYDERQFAALGEALKRDGA